MERLIQSIIKHALTPIRAEIEQFHKENKDLLETGKSEDTNRYIKNAMAAILSELDNFLDG